MLVWLMLSSTKCCTSYGNSAVVSSWSYCGDSLLRDGYTWWGGPLCCGWRVGEAGVGLERNTVLVTPHTRARILYLATLHSSHYIPIIFIPFSEVWGWIFGNCSIKTGQTFQLSRTDEYFTITLEGSSLTISWLTPQKRSRISPIRRK